jgi:hypothetical protein
MIALKCSRIAVLRPLLQSQQVKCQIERLFVDVHADAFGEAAR